ncbi:trypsin-like peptidase domain-containing protein [Oxynema aestuarii AP17]|uniref:Trypsin-like peptidase domain-containing protein n=2 Tax=Oxynema TaxID=1492710 RepID=A0A6H1TV53_9CYAN|nr:trypsin-like peptidase domain-containing protein [Oxynema aestuarii AP17]
MMLGLIHLQLWKLFTIAGSVASFSLFWVLNSIPDRQMSVTSAQVAPKVRLVNKPQALNQSSVSQSVPEIARQVTVRVIGNPGASSGVLIARRGNTYTVLTCQHCLSYNYDSASVSQFQVLTADGLTHSAQSLPADEFGSVDLGLVQFTSSRRYQVVEIAESQSLSVGDPVYVAGFPKWHGTNPDRVEDTSDWGWDAYRLTTGEVGMLLNRPLERGYGLGYTNDIETGMSGGPVLDRYGRLVGINGRSKYPLNGMDAFVFEDGSRPSTAWFRDMEALSWGIPISRFEQVQGRGSANSDVSPRSPVPIRRQMETPGW